MICDTNEFVGKRFFALEAVLPSFRPKWGRWVREGRRRVPAEAGRGVFRALRRPEARYCRRSSGPPRPPAGPWEGPGGVCRVGRPRFRRNRRVSLESLGGGDFLDGCVVSGFSDTE